MEALEITGQKRKNTYMITSMDPVLFAVFASPIKQHATCNISTCATGS